MENRLNTGWGLIGASTVAREHMVKAIRAQVGQIVEAVFSTSMDRAKAFATDCQIPTAYDSLDALLADPKVHAVYISTTNELHRSQDSAHNARSHRSRVDLAAYRQHH
jgi:1,5-anhydro-D-fructose reductase (1,5-anhydro-D-mannitol-forming)